MHVLAVDARLVGNAEVDHVPHHETYVVVHEVRVRCAAAERLEPHGAGPAEEVEHPGALDAVLQNVEHRGAHFLARGAELFRAHVLERAPAQSSGDDTHL
jgi:hypothetical protein